MFILTALSVLVVLALAAMVINLLRAAGEHARSTGLRRRVRLEGPEVLGPRIAPAGFTWVGGVANNDWNTPANYGANNTALPGPNDTVIFDNTSGTTARLPASTTIKIAELQINAGWQGTLDLNNSELDVTVSLSLADATGTIDGGAGVGNLGVLKVGNNAQGQGPPSFDWSNGTLNNLQLYVGLGTAQPPNVTGKLTWSGGTATSSILSFLTDSTVTTPVGASMAVTNSYLYNAGSFVHAATINFSGSQALNAGELDMNGGVLARAAGAAMSDLDNIGTIKTVQPAIPPLPGLEINSTIGINFDNDGTVESQQGTILRLRQAGVHTGVFIADAGSTLAFDLAPRGVAGTLNEIKPTASLQGPGLFDMDHGATLQIDNGATIRVGNFRLEQNGNEGGGRVSTLILQGNFSAHSFEWRSGTITAGELYVGVNDQLVMDDPAGMTGTVPRSLSAASIYNHGNILWAYAASPAPGMPAVAPGNLNMANGASIENDGALGQGVFTIATDDSIVQGAGNASVIDIWPKAVVQVPGSPAGRGPTIGVPVNNKGGTFKAFQPPVSLNAGYVQTDGLAEVDQGGVVNVAVTFEVDGGTVTDAGTINVACSVQQTGGTVDVNGGAVSATGAYNETGGAVTLESGTLAASGVNVSSGAILSGYGTVNAAVGNAGEIDATGGPRSLAVTGSYTQTAGVTNVNDGDTLSVGGAGTLSGGTINVSAPSTTALLNVAGAFTQQGGTINFTDNATLQTGSFTEQGGLIALGVGTLQASNGILIESGAVLDGAGTLTGAVTNSGSMIVDAYYGTFAAIDINGDYTQTSTGSLTLDLQGPYYYTMLSVSGKATLDGAFVLNSLNGVAPPTGDILSLVGWASYSGAFASLQLPSLSAGLYWYVQYTGTDFELSVQ